MVKIKLILKLLLGVVLALSALASLVNLVFIVGREETISVLNAVVGLAVLFFFLAPLAHVLIRNSLRELRGSSVNTDSESDSGSM